MAEGTIIALVLIAVVWGAVSLTIAPEFDEYADAVWWPIYAFKHILRALYRALFTGWRP